MKRLAIVRIVGSARLPDRIHRNRQQWMIGFQRVQLVSIRIGRGDHTAVPVKEKGAGRFADRKLRQKIRDAGKLDDDGEHAGALLIDIDRRRQNRGEPFAARMGSEDRPVFVIGLDSFAKPFLIGDGILAVLDAAAFQPDIVAGIVVLVDLQLAAGHRDFEHLDAGLAELVPGKERPIRPPERHRRNGRLRLQLRKEHEFTPSGVADIEHFFDEQRTHRRQRRSCLGGDRLQFVAHRGDDLLVNGVGQGLADLLRGAPPQQMHADGADDDRRQDKGRNGAANADAHAKVLTCRFNTELY